MQTTILLPEEEKEKLDLIARAEERTRSQVIRIAIRKYLEGVESKEKNDPNIADRV